MNLKLLGITARNILGAPAYDPANPWVVVEKGAVDAPDALVFGSSHCCERAAQEQERHLRACGRLNIYYALRPAPVQKGWRGNAHIDPGVTPKHVCGLAPRFVEGTENFVVEPAESVEACPC